MADPVKLPDGKPPLAREFSDAQLLDRLVKHTVIAQGGALGVVNSRDSYMPFKISAEYGSEAEDSPMAGAATYGLGSTYREALEQAGDDAGLWRSDKKVAEEVEKEQHNQGGSQ